MEKHHHQQQHQQFSHHKGDDEQKSDYSGTTYSTHGGYGYGSGNEMGGGGTGSDYNKEENRSGYGYGAGNGIGGGGTGSEYNKEENRSGYGFSQHEKQQFNHHKDDLKSAYSETTYSTHGGYGGGTGGDYNKEDKRHEHLGEIGTTAASGFAQHEKDQQSFNHHKDDRKTSYSGTNYSAHGGYGAGMGGSGTGSDYNKENKRQEYLGGQGTAAASGFAQHEKKRAEKDDEEHGGFIHNIGDKIGEAIGVGSGGHHDKKETRKEEEEDTYGHGKKKHSFF